jgi:tetratricopeptide (TPR) repeat protein
MGWIKSVSSVLEMIIRALLLIILLVVGTVLVVGLFRLGRAASKSITIASFTETGVNISNDKSKGLDQDIADALEFEILRIAQLHTLTNPWGSPQELPSLQMTGPQTVERVGGKISLGGIELPVEVVVEILKPLLARPRTQYMITGTFQKFLSGDGTRGKESGNMEEKADCLTFPSGDGTPVQIIIRLEADGRMLKRWSCKSLLTSAAEYDTENSSSLAGHLRKIAYEIMWIVLEGVEANSLENFKNFIKGVDLFRQYKDKKCEVFNDAEDTLSKAIEQNETYARAYFYLGNLYSWKAYYGKDEDIEREYEEKARSMYNKTKMNATSKPSEAEALGYFGHGLLDYRHYRKSKNQGKFSDVKLLDSAIEAFTASGEKDKEFYLARTGNALVYKEKAELLSQAKNGKEKEDYLDRAIKAFDDAKVVATALKDMDSIKWLDRQILDLNFKKRGVREEKIKGTVSPRNSVCP